MSDSGYQPLAFAVAGIRPWFTSTRILRFQNTGSLFQAQDIEDVVVTGFGELLLGLVQLASGVQHVDDGTGTHFVAGFGRLQGAVGGDHRLAVGAHRADAGVHVVVGGAHCALHRAEVLLQQFAGSHVVVLSLFHLGAGGATAVDWQLEGQTDIGLIVIAAALNTIQLVIGIAGLQSGTQIQRRLMAGFGQIDLLLGNVLADAGTVQLQVLVQRQLQPLVGTEGGLLRAETIGVQHVQIAVIDTGQLAQGLVAVVQRVFCIDLVSQRLVTGGFCFMDVGDGGQAHFETLLGLLQLTLYRNLVGTDELQGIHRLEHIKVGFGGAHHQVLDLEVVGDI